MTEPANVIHTAQMTPPLSRTPTFSSAGNYPWPSEVNVADFVPLKLSPTNYFVWKQLMLNFIESHGLVGFVDGTIQPPPENSGRGKETAAGSSSREAENQEHSRSWNRSNGVVRRWIFAMIPEEILTQLVRLKTATEVWIELEKMFTHPFKPALHELELTNPETGRILSLYLPLHKAALNGDWDKAATFLVGVPDGVRDGITWCAETALIVAVRSAKRNHFVEKLLEKMLPEDVAKPDLAGATALHAAVDGGNIVAVKWLVEKNRKLPNIGDKDRTLPLHVAAGHGNREMVVYLLGVTKEDDVDLKPFEDKTGLKLLHGLAASGLFDIALALLQRYPRLASIEPSPLVAMAHKRSSFRSGTMFNFWQRLIYSGIPLKLEGNANLHNGNDVENPATEEQNNANLHNGNDVENPATEEEVSAFAYLRQKLQATFWDVAEKLVRQKQKLQAITFWDVAEKLVPPIKSIRETKLIHHQALRLVKHLCEEVVKSDYSKASKIFIAPLRGATCMGIHEIVEEILESFPSAIHLKSEKHQTIFHVAIVYRRENVFNLIYQLGENRHALLSMPDASTNNALHAAGNLLPQQQLSLRASAPGAALQMQRELQWFKEVEKFVLPHDREGPNAEGKTPAHIFTETHKDLVKEGEQWMKDTAMSCTIVAALIVTVVFAAAITVPGGTDGEKGNDNGRNKGLPIFLKTQAFILFGVSDALALFSSTASLLMFLSILTSRYGEQDFLYSLPRRLIIGLVTLFLSIISMMIAFGATLYIVFGDKKVWTLIPVAVSSCVPITLFVLLQFPLLLDMIQSTYYPGIFKKQSDRTLY